MTLEYLRIMQFLIMIFGGIVAYFALKSSRRTGSRSMLLLGLGFALVAVGAGAAGILFELISVDFATALAVQATSQVVGFFVIVHSLIESRE